jgi:hypothetical protein
MKDIEQTNKIDENSVIEKPVQTQTFKHDAQNGESTATAFQEQTPERNEEIGEDNGQFELSYTFKKHFKIFQIGTVFRYELNKLTHSTKDVTEHFAHKYPMFDSSKIEDYLFELFGGYKIDRVSIEKDRIFTEIRLRCRKFSNNQRRQKQLWREFRKFILHISLLEWESKVATAFNEKIGSKLLDCDIQEVTFLHEERSAIFKLELFTKGAKADR